MHKFQGGTLYLQPEGLFDAEGKMVMSKDAILAGLNVGNGRSVATTPETNPKLAVSAIAEPKQWVVVKNRDELEEFYRGVLMNIRAEAYAHGYAIGLHGSMRRDLDLIAIPWTDDHADKDDLAHAIQEAALGLPQASFQWEKKPQGRLATSFPVCWPEWNETNVGHIDLSVMPGFVASQSRPTEEWYCGAHPRCVDQCDSCRRSEVTRSSTEEPIDWLEIDTAYSAALEHRCTCGESEHGEMHCPHCNRWEKARAMLQKALRGTPSAIEAPEKRESIVTTIGDDAILYLQLQNFDEGERVEIMVTPYRADRTGDPSNDIRDEG